MCLYVQCTQQVMYCCTLILYMCLVYRLTVHTLVVYHCTLEYVYRCTVCTTSTVLVHVYIDVVFIHTQETYFLVNAEYGLHLYIWYIHVHVYPGVYVYNTNWDVRSSFTILYTLYFS